eukprot:jgi/Tetstr1/457431/TSEL_004215.t1
MGEGDDAQALSLQWSFSFSRHVPGGAAYLSNGEDDRVAYASAHTLVIYDAKDHSQMLLQGHKNPITTLAASPDKRLVITADQGPDSMLIVWDPIEGEPLRTLHEPHPGGVLALDLYTGPGGELMMVTLGAAEPGTGEQSIALREVFGESEGPVIECAIPVGDVQRAVTVNQGNPAEIMTNGEQRVYFWGSQLPVSNTFKYYSPPLSQRDFKQAIGAFTESAFIPNTTQAVTGTVDGDIIVWEQQGISAQIGTRATDRRAIKMLRIHHAPVRTVTAWGVYVVTGADDGNVRFFDPQMRLMAWFEDMEAGGITSIDFAAVMPDAANGSGEEDVAQFQVPCFTIGTDHAKICIVDSRSFEDPSLKYMSRMVQEGCPGSVSAMVTDPIRPEFVVTGSQSMLQRWCMHTRKMLSQAPLPHGLANAVAFSRDGSQLMVGYESGMLQLLQASNLTEIASFKNTFKPITQVAICSSGRHMAIMDKARYLGLYVHEPAKGENRWEYIGKYRAHYSDVVGLHFGEAPSGATRLFSLGKDGRVAEFDLEASSVANGVKLAQLSPVAGVDGASAVPTAMAFAPPLPYHVAGATNTMLLVADDQYKLSMFDADFKATNATYLGPTYAGPITSMAMFRSVASKEHNMAYATEDRIVGLVSMPLDGNPEKSMGLIAHPGPIAAMAISYDGRKMITAGPDGVMNMWGINTTSLDLAVTSAAVGAESKWAKLLLAGEGEAAFQEIQDYYYYAQIRSQGEDTTAPREIDGKIPVEALPDVLRALGYYPSKMEISSMLADINAKAAARDQPAPTHITFEQFLSLYANYRPVSGVIKDDITAAFAALSPAGGRELSKEELYTVLTTEGEPMTDEELAECLYILTGLETQGALKELFPPVVTAKGFAEDILGFQDDGREV